MDKKLYVNPPLVNRVYDWKNGPQPRTRRELDTFFNAPAIRAIKRQICEMGRRIYNKGYTDGNGGNLSVRVGEDLVLCSPTLCCKGFMKEEDICLVDMEAGQLCGYRPRTSEVKVHIAMMKATGMNACMHCHPPHCNAFLFAGQVPPSGINPEADIFLNQIPLAPYATPGSKEVAESVAEAAKKSNVVFMENHGVVCGGRDIEEAEWFAENADAYCQVLLLSGLHKSPVKQLGERFVKDIVDIRKAMGLNVPEGQALYNTHEYAGYAMNMKKLAALVEAAMSAFGGIAYADMGILGVAMLVSALDGEVRDEEYAAFSTLARKCCRLSKAAEADALECSLRAAGYLALQARRLAPAQLVKVFVLEALKVLPADFAKAEAKDVRRAFVMWTAMAMADDDYSDVERACIAALAKKVGGKALKGDFLARAEVALSKLDDTQTAETAAMIVGEII